MENQYLINIILFFIRKTKLNEWKKSWTNPDSLLYLIFLRILLVDYYYFLFKQQAPSFPFEFKCRNNKMWHSFPFILNPYHKSIDLLKIFISSCANGQFQIRIFDLYYQHQMERVGVVKDEIFGNSCQN